MSLTTELDLSKNDFLKRNMVFMHFGDKICTASQKWVTINIEYKILDVLKDTMNSHGNKCTQSSWEKALKYVTTLYQIFGIDSKVKFSTTWSSFFIPTNEECSGVFYEILQCLLRLVSIKIKSMEHENNKKIITGTFLWCCRVLTYICTLMENAGRTYESSINLNNKILRFYIDYVKGLYYESLLIFSEQTHNDDNNNYKLLSSISYRCYTTYDNIIIEYDNAPHLFKEYLRYKKSLFHLLMTFYNVNSYFFLYEKSGYVNNEYLSKCLYMIKKTEELLKYTPIKEAINEKIKIQKYIINTIDKIKTDNEKLFNNMLPCKDKIQESEIKIHYPEIRCDVIQNFSNLSVLCPKIMSENRNKSIVYKFYMDHIIKIRKRLTILMITKDTNNEVQYTIDQLLEYMNKIALSELNQELKNKLIMKYKQAKNEFNEIDQKLTQYNKKYSMFTEDQRHILMTLIRLNETGVKIMKRLEYKYEILMEKITQEKKIIKCSTALKKIKESFKSGKDIIKKNVNNCNINTQLKDIMLSDKILYKKFDVLYHETMKNVTFSTKNEIANTLIEKLNNSLTFINQLEEQIHKFVKGNFKILKQL